MFIQRMRLYITIHHYLWPISCSSCHWTDDGSMKRECVCVYVCMYVYVCVCMYVCTCVCTYVCTHACMYVCMYVWRWVQKFLVWHTKATPTGTRCEGSIAPSMVRLMYRYYVCWNKGRLYWEIAKLFCVCHLKKLVRLETSGPTLICMYV
jgi:hypothetical protein